MNVKELINILEKVENKELVVKEDIVEMLVKEWRDKVKEDTIKKLQELDPESTEDVVTAFNLIYNYLDFNEDYEMADALEMFIYPQD